MFYSFSTKIHWSRGLAASDLFFMFTQSINFYAFYCRISKMFEKCYSSNRQKWVVASFSISARFTAKFVLVFVLTQEKAFSWRLHFKANRKRIGSSKKTILGIFKIAFRLRDRHVFMWQSLKILNVFNTLSVKTIFSKTKNFFKRLEYRFLVEITEIEKTKFP